MVTDPKTLFTSLAIGDLLMVPVSLTLRSINTEKTFYVTVLNTDKKGGLYLSQFSDDTPSAMPDVSGNPFRWSDDKDALVNHDGEVPGWYTKSICVERGAAMKAATEYMTVPKVEQLRQRITEADLEKYKESSWLKTIAGISLNGEAGNNAEQLSLVMDLMGITYTKEQLIGVSLFLLGKIAVSKHNITTITVDLSFGDDDSPKTS